MDITTATPVEIDTRLAALYAEAHSLRTRIQQYREHIVGEVARHLGRGWKGKATWTEVETYLDNCADYDSLLRYHQQMVEWQRSLEPVLAEMADLNQEFIDRGCWTRAFLAITSGGGHVHSSMECSTCFAPGYDGMGNWREGTLFQWLPELSDHAEDAIVEKAGERACTVCYPSAPVDVLRRPTQIFSKDEERKAAERIEREAKRAERQAAEVTVAVHDGAQQPRNKTFKSERAVTNYIAGLLSSLVLYGTDHPSSGSWAYDVEACRSALAAKGVEYDYDKALANARKKVTREGGAPQY